MKGQRTLSEDRLLMSFYADPANIDLYNRKHFDKRASCALDERFKHFHLKARMVSYTDKLARYYSKEFDKQKRFQRNQLQLDTPNDQNEDQTAINFVSSNASEPDDAVTLTIPDILPTEKLQKAYKELSDEKKNILSYHVLDQLNNKEIAKRMNCSPQNISKLKIKTLKELRGVEAHGRN